MNRPENSLPWRVLAALAVLVMAVHVLVLQASPARLGTQLDLKAAATSAFSTRSIEARPVPEAVISAPAIPAQSVAGKAARPTPKKQSNTLPGPVESPQVAINSIANELAQNAAESSAANVQGSATHAELNPPETARIAAAATPGSTGTPTLATPPVGPQTTPVTAISLPGSARLEYKMTGTSKGLNYFADAELVWTNNGVRYDALMKVSAMFLGSRSMTSAGLITPGGLAPTRFSDKFRSEQAAHFEAEKGKITFSANTPDAPWIEGAQDRVSVFLQLGGMLAGKPADFPPGSSITLYTIGPREADTWTFTVEAEETLQLLGSEIQTVKLTRKPRREYDQKVEIWYAPSLGYLPVRNRVTQQNGDFIDQKLINLGRL